MIYVFQSLVALAVLILIAGAAAHFVNAHENRVKIRQREISDYNRWEAQRMEARYASRRDSCRCDDRSLAKPIPRRAQHD